MIRTITLAVAALVLAAAAAFSQQPAATPPPAATTTAPAAPPTALASAAPAAAPTTPAAAAPARGAGAAAATVAAAPAAVPSLGTRASWLSDRRPLHIGDILTVLVAESTSASEQTATNATANRAFDAQLNVNTGNTSILVGPQKELASGLSNNSQEEGDASRQGNLTATLAVKIIAIDAMGNAQIEGSKFVQIDGRQQEVKISGLVRADDVTYDDQISSTRIANATISYKGKTIKPKQGFIGKIVSLLWP
jgi:flagellar L-ring protein FlgH